jgi:hypothetical protein
MLGGSEDTVLNDNDQAVPTWFDEFFGERNIVKTTQVLLEYTSRTTEDLCAFCTALHQSSIILALTSEGLAPVAGDHLYVFPYTKMSKRQLCAIQTTVAVSSDQFFACTYSHDQYIVTERREYKVDDALLLFAATCILLQGLNTTTTSKFGYTFTKLDSQQVEYYVNTTVFRIVNACRMPRGVLSKTERLLHEHSVVPRRSDTSTISCDVSS